MDHLLNQNQAAKLLGLSPRTLERFRTTGNGPRFARLGRRIFYREHDLNEWVERNLRTSTSNSLATARAPSPQNTPNKPFGWHRARRNNVPPS